MGEEKNKILPQDTHTQKNEIILFFLNIYHKYMFCY